LSGFYALASAVCRLVLRVGWRFRTVDADRVPPSGPLILAANHVSYFDPPALACGLPRPIHYMAKAQLFRIPLLGTIIRWCYAYPVDRSRGDVGAIKRSVEVLRTGAAVGVFPEGTRNKSGTVVPQGGVALLHQLSGAPIVPAYITGTGAWRRFHRIQVIYGEPFRLAKPGEKASREDLAKWTGEIMGRITTLRERLGAD
jgi:1-acyl-sn-glycerol-3-phosphate acyltransferase